MNILGLTSHTSGCGYHRVLIPLGFMDGIKGYVTNIITEDKVDGWDLILYNRMCPYDTAWPETLDMLGFPKVVLDLDDYWRLPPNHMNYQHYEIHGERIENNIAQADMVTVTNKSLYDKVYPLNNNVHIFNNAIPFGRNQFTEDKQKSDLVRIFWCGGVTHEPDIAMLRNPIRKLKIHADKIQMVLGGYTDTDDASKWYWQRMFSSFTAGGSLPWKKLHGTSATNYMAMYEHADIMVIPLEESDWHACKSNLKILEAASKRVPCIVSNVAPYNLYPDCPVLWVNSQKDWFSHLNYLILNPEARQELGNKLYGWAKENFSIDKINAGRVKAFANLCGS